MKHLMNPSIVNVKIMENMREPFKWNPESVLSLIEHIKLHWDDFHNSMKKKKCIWDTISLKMSSEGYYVSAVECDKKFRNIKSRYFLALENKLLKNKKLIRIEYFSELDSLLGCQPTTLAKLEQRKLELNQEAMHKKAINREVLHDFKMDRDSSYEIFDDTIVKTEWCNETIENFLCLLKEFKDCFTDPVDSSLSAEVIWEVVSEHMQLKGYNFDIDECRTKWQSLVKEFNVYKKTNQRESWPYFDMVEDVILTVPIPIRGKKRKASNTEERIAKNICLELPMGQTKPSTSIKIESLEDSFEEQDDGESRAKYSQMSLAMSQLEENFNVWRNLNKIENLTDTRLHDCQRTLEESKLSLQKMAAEASALLSNLNKKNSISEPTEENITIVLPNDTNT